MARDAARRFLAQVDGSEDLKARVRSIFERHEGAGFARVVTLAAENGYETTAEALSEALRSRARSELSDEQLEAVAGGAPTAASSFSWSFVLPYIEQDNLYG